MSASPASPKRTKSRISTSVPPCGMPIAPSMSGTQAMMPPLRSAAHSTAWMLGIPDSCSRRISTSCPTQGTASGCRKSSAAEWSGTPCASIPRAKSSCTSPKNVFASSGSKERQISRPHWSCCSLPSSAAMTEAVCCRSASSCMMTAATSAADFLTFEAAGRAVAGRERTAAGDRQRPSSEEPLGARWTPSQSQTPSAPSATVAGTRPAGSTKVTPGPEVRSRAHHSSSLATRFRLELRSLDCRCCGHSRGASASVGTPRPWQTSWNARRLSRMSSGWRDVCATSVVPADMITRSWRGLASDAILRSPLPMAPQTSMTWSLSRFLNI
mmetsp:Transcript_36688/g.104857  ORF Transcript_36688/g.104857 Transcript_36688/m.104857 type:complete len:327 (-) Transcript_36688:345-1325(-)